MHDEDLVVGRKEILSFLRLSDWRAVRKRVREGLPVVKVCGRIEMSRLKYRAWKRDENCQNVPEVGQVGQVGRVGQVGQTFSISEARNLTGISKETLRRWDRAGKVSPQRTTLGHRRYTRMDLDKISEKGNVNEEGSRDQSAQA